jgi:hypothetical protein
MGQEAFNVEGERASCSTNERQGCTQNPIPINSDRLKRTDHRSCFDDRKPISIHVAIGIRRETREHQLVTIR